ncbi:MAG: hypothetical protein PHC64_06345 [Candidatus Gastranaerophilales bacterium]|nr:hypothetical protein [Candidatus Gastranaerophilales bacterium]
MNSAKVKSLVSVFALMLFVGLIAIGCKQEVKQGWVNTSSMPGQTFRKHSNSAKQPNSTIVYLDSSKENANSNFGPQDVSFEFRDLK